VLNQRLAVWLLTNHQFSHVCNEWGRAAKSTTTSLCSRPGCSHELLGYDSVALDYWLIELTEFLSNTEIRVDSVQTDTFTAETESCQAYLASSVE
jgi:hypothetical protein